MGVSKRIGTVGSAALMGCLLIGCRQTISVRILPASTPTDLRFDLEAGGWFSRAPFLDSFEVRRCGDGTSVWSIWTSSSHRVGEIRYGEVPQGWRAEHAAETLLPGCYLVVPNEDRLDVVGFTVERDERIVELQHDVAKRLLGELDRRRLGW